VRGQIAVQFFEKRRRKAWFTKGEEEICWEQWTLDVTLATPRTESGKSKITIPEGQMTEDAIHRKSKGPQGDGDHVVQNSHEDCHNGKQRERSHSADHDQRDESLPLSNQHKSKG
jgi:hypothetical protein